jgi:hypothetical protein
MSKIKPNKLFTDKIKRIPHRREALFVIGFAAIGIVLLVATRAATPFAGLEPEQGTLSVGGAAFV